MEISSEHRSCRLSLERWPGIFPDTYWLGILSKRTGVSLCRSKFLRQLLIFSIRKPCIWKQFPGLYWFRRVSLCCERKNASVKVQQTQKESHLSTTFLNASQCNSGVCLSNSTDQAQPCSTSAHLAWVSEVAQLCRTLCDPMGWGLPGSSVHGIFQARVLSGLPFPSPGDLPDPGIEPRSPALQADALPSEPSGKPTHLAWPRTISE